MARSIVRSRLVCVLTCCAVPALGMTASALLHASSRAAATQDEPGSTKQAKKSDGLDVRTDAELWAKIKHPVLWHRQARIESLDLLAGQAGDKQPKAPYTFLEEDKGGTNPKFDVRDANGKKWHCKTGDEAQPEVVASRLLWAMGYYVNDDVVVPQAAIAGMAMTRGDDEVKRGVVTNARFSRKPGGQDKMGTWGWKSNPFYGTREFNGLRVMMAVMNNWDLKDVNNSVYEDKRAGTQIFLVNDVGATFGTNGVSWSKSKSKGNVESFKDSRFIERRTSAAVDFATPKRPTGILLATLGATAKSFAMRKDLDWIGKGIPLEDARWMGSLLGQLSHQQLVDAFHAGNFPEEEVQVYVEVVEKRISDLKRL